MSDLSLLDSLKKDMSNKRLDITNVMADGMLKDMEHYKHLQGQLEMLNFIEMSIQEFYKENKF
tara:strand:- start:786 stop:974 length:189 start_codon:yes stop_codon:yes gene_type:complete